MEEKDPLFSEMLRNTFKEERVSEDFSKLVMDKINAQPAFEIKPLINRKSWIKLGITMGSILILSSSLLVGAQLEFSWFFTRNDLNLVYTNVFMGFIALCAAGAIILFDEVWRRVKRTKHLVS